MCVCKCVCVCMKCLSLSLSPRCTEVFVCLCWRVSGVWSVARRGASGRYKQV